MPKDWLRPVLVNPRLQSQQEAETDPFAFSDEVRQRNEAADHSDLISVTEVPCIRGCYGWMPFTGEELYEGEPRTRSPYI